MADEKPKEGVKTENNDHINLKVAGQDGSVVQFKIKRHTPLSKLMKAYCERQGLTMRQIRFRFDGQPINETDTPAQVLQSCNGRCIAACPFGGMRAKKKKPFRATFSDVELLQSDPEFFPSWPIRGRARAVGGSMWAGVKARAAPLCPDSLFIPSRAESMRAPDKGAFRPSSGSSSPSPP
ncbi:small ubiquitin-related modifier 2 [Clarias magur]|uniref:Small ubiquitin-related modifier 2 n=1 Tax=Clarias magur TaxID=1594786 RepID=A0A8J4X6I1_CLAMG|nr:small ubiquitin-related modifier 2 [Clarias magur]